MQPLAQYEQLAFLNRLRSLQWMCSESDKNSPKALLFVPGADGRHNSGSTWTIKYLFSNAVGKNLFDDNFDGNYEILEDLVVLIKEFSVSIIASDPMKQVLSQYLAVIPKVIVYGYSQEECEDIDKFQFRKCFNFKKMVLEALESEDGIGLCVPVGYDDILDVENWPLLQSFALDNLFASTGFFTARHAVADITSNLDVLFRSVDCSFVQHAVLLTKTIIRPHVLEFISALDTNIPSQRKKLTANEVIGPLEVLYEFGELDAVGSLEKVSPPIVLFGAQTTQIGTLQQVNGAASIAWKDQIVGDSLHLVFEGCEPSTGMRFCRTYFMRHGTADKLVRNAKEHYKELLSLSSSSAAAKAAATSEAKVEFEEEQDDFSDFVLSAESEDVTSPSFLQSLEDIKRMMSLYVKLWFALRVLVHDLFLSSQDVLTAATDLQRRLNDVLRNANDSSNEEVEFLTSMAGTVQANEKLQLHIDCMNALGEIITLEDVQDMGGVCWVNIRATINGIQVGYGLRKQNVAIAVGDTFLFSPLAKPTTAEQNKLKMNHIVQSLIPHVTDCSCITAIIPYFSTLLHGGGIEEDYRRLVQFLLKNQQLTSPLQLGKVLEFNNGSGMMRLPCFVDYHPMPCFEASVQCFTSGFIIDRIARVNHVPVAISFEKNVRQVWITDTNECLAQVNTLAFGGVKSQLLDALHDSLLDGYLITFEMKDEAEHEEEEEGKGGESSPATATVNPMQRLFANLNHSPSPKYISLFIRYNNNNDGQSNKSFPALEAWKIAFRRLDIAVLTGRRSLHDHVPVPEAILTSLLIFADSLIARSTAAVYTSSESGTDSTKCSDMVEVVSGYCSSIGIPGKAQIALLTMHALAKARRLSPFHLDGLTPATAKRNAASKEKNIVNVVIAGCAGNGIRSIHDLMIIKLPQSLSSDLRFVVMELDFAMFVIQHSHTHDEVLSFIEATIQRAMKQIDEFIPTQKVVLLTLITLSPVVQIKLTDICTVLTCLTQSRIASVATVISTDTLIIDSNSTQHNELIGLGIETWSSLSMELMHAASADMVFIVEPSSSSPHYAKLRDALEISNPSATLVRVHSHAPAIAVQDLEAIVTAILANNTSSKLELSEREAQLIVLGYPSPEQVKDLGHDIRQLDVKATFFPQPKEANSVLNVVQINLPWSDIKEESKHWALSSLLTLLASLFPLAKGGTYRIKQQWELGMNNNHHKASSMSGFERLVKIASLRVLAQRQEKAIGGLDGRLKEIIKHRGALWNALKQGILSIDGTAMLKGETIGNSTSTGYQLIRIEANHSFVAVNEINVSNNNAAQQSRLLFHGVFSPDTIALLQEIVSLCEKRRLPRQRILSLEDIDMKKKIELQVTGTIQDRPLPTGWWFDGHHYINFHGAAADLRPDIDEIVEEYVTKQNKKALAYNVQLDDMGY